MLADVLYCAFESTTENFSVIVQLLHTLMKFKDTGYIYNVIYIYTYSLESNQTLICD